MTETLQEEDRRASTSQLKKRQRTVSTYPHPTCGEYVIIYTKTEGQPSQFKVSKLVTLILLNWSFTLLINKAKFACQPSGDEVMFHVC